MATKTLTATAEYEKDTAKGKRRYNVEGKGISGSLYIEDGNAAADYEVTLKPASE
jgi:hypothetical protein